MNITQPYHKVFPVKSNYIEEMEHGPGPKSRLLNFNLQICKTLSSLIALFVLR